MSSGWQKKHSLQPSSTRQIQPESSGVARFKEVYHDRKTINWKNILCAALIAFLLISQLRPSRPVGRAQRTTIFESIDGKHTLLFEQRTSFGNCLEAHFNSSSLINISNIAPEEFIQRRDNLAKALLETSVDAFVVEPGFTFYYYANLSQSDWEPWEPEERPFLMVVLPNMIDDTIKASTFFLVPSFEVQRALLSNIPFIDESEIVPWEEEEDPYEILTYRLADKLHKVPNKISIVADEELRNFIAKGIEQTGVEVKGLNIPISNVREKKSVAEVAILRAANTATISGLAAVQKCLMPGLTQSLIESSLNKLFKNRGATPFFNIVLFEENAAIPHGGIKADRRLTRDDFVLMDVGVHLYYYSSDVSRTFLMDLALSCNTTYSGCVGRNVTLFTEKLKVWDIVLKAQKAAIETMRPGNTAASVDIAARNIISDAGYGGSFTHRLGHGIGIKAHESPYLNRGNFGRHLTKGMCFTAEPGVYISGVLGVRHEDVILVTDDRPELLTAGLAQSPWHL